MPGLRIVCYVVGLIMALVLTGQLLRIRHMLARLLAVAMAAWAVNCVTLLVLIYLLITGEPLPAWRDLLTTINALLLAAIPIALYAWFLKVNGQGNHG